MIAYGEFQSHQRKHRAQKTFALASPKSEHLTQHQGRLNGQIRIALLATACRSALCGPTRQRFRRQPKGQAATAANSYFVFRPVRHFELHLADVVADGGVMFIWQINREDFDFSGLMPNH
jgi:hypothetical protein